MNLYVHVPFCAVKCRYCAFHSEEGAGADAMRRFARLLPRELEMRGLCGGRPDTLYVGGGTPSLLGAEGIAALLRALPRPSSGAETTVECNPGDVTDDFAAALRDSGVTRASLGVQSFSDRALRWLGRRHDAARARAAFASLRKAGIPSVSVDLICALPGAPEGEFAATLRETAALSPDHVSVYPLSVEPGTPLALAGTAPAGDAAVLREVRAAERFLRGLGFARYELSNYARPGFECRHNLAAWNGEDYSGAGPAAHSREGLFRRANAPGVAAWLAALEAGSPPPADVSRVSAEEDAAERFVTRIRLSAWSAPDPAAPGGARRLEALAGLRRAGVARPLGGGKWTLTARGREVADAVMAELV